MRKNTGHEARPQRRQSKTFAATIVEFAGGEVPDHIIEGRSLLPFLHGQKLKEWREYAVSEYDYSISPMAAKLGLAPRDARLFMICDKRWKFIHVEGRTASGEPFAPILFDLQNDPEEFYDLGRDVEHTRIIALTYERLGEWGRRMSQRTTKSELDILNMRGRGNRKGILIGVYDEGDVAPETTEKYRGKAKGWPAKNPFA